MEPLSVQPEPTTRPRTAPLQDAVLVAHGIEKKFGAVTALRDATMAIRGGTVTALVGDNGAGKSTLVKILSGVLQPDDGQLMVDGEQITFPTPRAARAAGIHTVFQDLALVGSLTIAENLFLCSEIHATARGVRLPWLDRGAMRAASRGALDNLGITTVSNIDARVEDLSGGQRQSIAIARAVREQARVVMLDEPTAALGVAQAAQVLGLVQRLRDAGTAVLVISHNLREVFAVSDVVVVMRLGTVSRVFETRGTSEEEVVAAIVGARRSGEA